MDISLIGYLSFQTLAQAPGGPGSGHLQVPCHKPWRPPTPPLSSRRGKPTPPEAKPDPGGALTGGAVTAGALAAACATAEVGAALTGGAVTAGALAAACATDEAA